MTLSFSTKWPERMGELAGQPNYFTNKIVKGVWKHSPLLMKEFVLSRTEKEKKRFEEIKPFEDLTIKEEESLFSKLHTIRHDPHNRWKPGMKIHPVINNRTKNRFQFAPVVKCVSVQKIEIKYWNKCGDYPNIIIDKHYGYHAYEKDGFEFMEQLALNDGFPSVEAFFQYFNADFKGKLIHWTDLKY